MIKCKYGDIADYADCTYEDLIKLRAEVMADIISFEEEWRPEENWWKKPGADYEYRLNLRFLANLMNDIAWKYHREQDAMLDAIGRGECKIDPNESMPSQVKRFTRHMLETALEEGTQEHVEFAVKENGTLEAYIDGERAGTVVDIFATHEFDYSDLPLREDRRYLLLKAVCHYKKYIGAGSLRKTVWEIYSDGSYYIRQIYNLNWDELERSTSEEAENGNEVVSDGMLDSDAFHRLEAAASKEIWRNAYIRQNVRDDSEWMVYMYDPAGHVIRDSGSIGTLRGNKNLEAIVSCLPRD